MAVTPYYLSLIDLDDPCVEINGLTAKLYQPAASEE